MTNSSDNKLDSLQRLTQKAGKILLIGTLCNLGAVILVLLLVGKTSETDQKTITIPYIKIAVSWEDGSWLFLFVGAASGWALWIILHHIINLLRVLEFTERIPQTQIQTVLAGSSFVLTNNFGRIVLCLFNQFCIFGFMMIVKESQHSGFYLSAINIIAKKGTTEAGVVALLLLSVFCIFIFLSYMVLLISPRFFFLDPSFWNSKFAFGENITRGVSIEKHSNIQIPNVLDKIMGKIIRQYGFWQGIKIVIGDSKPPNEVMMESFIQVIEDKVYNDKKGELTDKDKEDLNTFRSSVRKEMNIW